MVAAAVEDRVLGEVERLCHAGLDETALLGGVVESLRRAIPFDAYCASATDPASGLMTRTFTEEMGGEKEAAFYLEHVYFEQDLEETLKAARDGRSVTLLSELTGEHLERSASYRGFLRPLDLAHTMSGVFAADGGIWGTLDLAREGGRRDFEAREVALFKRLAPHLSAGLKIATLREDARSETGGDGVSGVLVLDSRGMVLHHTAAAEHWLGDLADLGPGWREGVGLPAAIWTLAGALRTALKPETEKSGVPRLRVRSRSGRWLTLQAARSEPRADGRTETVVVIEPAGPREVAWMNTAAYGLSSREREIVDLVARAASTREISTTLYISEYTVQEHLSNIFDKVGVRSRRALVKRLYLDAIYP
jgi:DNA-binding CsgD family transcriptional regulator